MCVEWFGVIFVLKMWWFWCKVMLELLCVELWLTYLYGVPVCSGDAQE